MECFYTTEVSLKFPLLTFVNVNKQIKEGNLPEGYSHGYISVFRFHLSPDIAIHTFDSADKDWLHFVASNRRKSLFPTVRKNYAAFDIMI
jgi:hypothetical protein